MSYGHFDLFRARVDFTEIDNIFFLLVCLKTYESFRRVLLDLPKEYLKMRKNNDRRAIQRIFLPSADYGGKYVIN